MSRVYLISPLHRRHAKWHSRLFHLGFVDGANFRWLVFVFEQVTAFVLAEIWPPGVADQTQTASERQVARRFFTYREVMMIPAFRWHQ